MRRKHPTKIRLTQEEALELQQEVALGLAKATKKFLDNFVKDLTAYSERVTKNVEASFLRKLAKERQRSRHTVMLSDLQAAGKDEDVLAKADADLEHARGDGLSEEQIMSLVGSFNRPGGRDVYDVLVALIDHREIDRRARWRDVQQARNAIKSLLDR